MAVPCVKNHYGRTYFDEFLPTCLMGASFFETQCMNKRFVSTVRSNEKDDYFNGIHAMHDAVAVHYRREYLTSRQIMPAYSVNNRAFQTETQRLQQPEARKRCNHGNGR